MGNLLSRLSENLYIHSSPVNFAYVASGMYKRYEYEGDMLDAVQDELNDAERTLTRQILEITDLCNQFYDEFNLGAHDSVVLSEFNDDQIFFDLNGAKAFQNKFLISINRNIDGNIGQRLSRAMNNKQYQSECKRLFKERALVDKNSVLDLSKQKEFRELIGQIAKGYTSIDLTGITEITMQTVLDVLSKLTETTTTKKKGSLFTTQITKSFRPKVVKNINNIDLNSNQLVKSIFADEEGTLFNLSKQSGATRAAQNFKDYFLQVSLNEFVDILWTVLMRMEPSLSRVINENRFKEFFLSELKMYSSAIFNIESSNFIGMLLEQPLVFGINLDLDAFFKNSVSKVKARNIGQDQEFKTFADGTSGMYQSGSDIAFDIFDSNGKVKKTYRIQAKILFRIRIF